MWLFFHQVWLSPPDSSLLWSVSSKHSGDVCFVLIGSPLAQILHIECLNQRSGQVMMTLLISTCVYVSCSTRRWTALLNPQPLRQSQRVVTVCRDAATLSHFQPRRSNPILAITASSRPLGRGTLPRWSWHDMSWLDARWDKNVICILLITWVLLLCSHLSQLLHVNCQSCTLHDYFGCNAMSFSWKPYLKILQGHGIRYNTIIRSYNGPQRNDNKRLLGWTSTILWFHKMLWERFSPVDNQMYMLC